MPKITRTSGYGIIFRSRPNVVGSIIEGIRFYEDHENIMITIFDVGQGDSVLIRYQGQVIVVDGGPNKNFPALLEHELPFFEDTIDYLILSHPQKDHFGGFINLSEHYSIGAFVISPATSKVLSYQKFETKIKKEHIPIVFASDIEDIFFGEKGKIKIFSPQNKDVAQHETNVNNAAIVFRLSFGSMDMLFTGDIEEKMEKELVEKYGHNLQSEILKVPHHGSHSSSSWKFLQNVSPDVAFISSGKNNSYGHPHALVLQRLLKIGSKIFRTDEHGTMRFIIKENGYCQIKSFFVHSCQFY